MRPDFVFGLFELDLQSHQLRKRGVRVSLPRQSLEILIMLLERPGQVVTRDEIRQRLWPDGTVVEFDHSVNAAVNRLRAHLDDSAATPRYIETLPRMGYRFIAPAEGASAAEFPTAEEHRPAAAAAKGAGARRLSLKRPAIAFLVLAGISTGILLSINVVGQRSRLPPKRAFPRIQAVAVLPFENLSRDSEQEYLADGMTDALITHLAKIGTLRIISRQSVMRYKGSRTPLPEIAHELNVDAIVEGAVQRFGDRVHVTAQLLHGKSDRHLWADTYDRDFRDVLKLQGELAQAIARGIGITITTDEQRLLGDAGRVNPEAYQLYLQGRYQFSKRTITAFEKSIQLFGQALEKDPRSALAYAGLAESYGILPFFSASTPRIAFPRARAAAQKALELDGSLAEAHAALGFVLLWHDWNWPEAELELKQALKLKPNYAVGHHWYAEYLSVMGRHQEAISEIRRAQELDPLSSLMQTIGGEVFYYARRYDDAMEQDRKALFLDPNFRLAYEGLAQNYAQKGMYEEAFAQCEEAQRLSRGEGRVLASVAYVYAMAGKRKQALALVEPLLGSKSSGEIPPTFAARIYVGLGQKEMALAWLEKASEERDPYMVFLNVAPLWDTLRSSPRFQELLRRMKFPS